jgi:hypothetical protein
MSMKRSLLAAVLLTLVLPGCAAGGPAPTPTVTVTVTDRAEPAPTVTVTVTPTPVATTPTPEANATLDLTTDAGICAADAELTNLELNDALAPLLGYPADRDSRTFEQDEAIREHKNAALSRECPARAG